MNGRYHLPAIIDRHDGRPSFTLAAGCGKRGPLAARDVALSSALFSADTHCHDCLVLWDEAEEKNTLRVVWALNGPVWANIGGVAHDWDWLKEIARSASGSGPAVSRWAAGLAERMSTMAVIVRDQPPKVKKT